MILIHNPHIKSVLLYTYIYNLGSISRAMAGPDPEVPTFHWESKSLESKPSRIPQKMPPGKCIIFHYTLTLQNVIFVQNDFNSLQRLSDRSALVAHMRTVHCEDRRFICHICARPFKTKSCLQTHLVRHTGRSFTAYLPPPHTSDMPSEHGYNKLKLTISS